MVPLSFPYGISPSLLIFYISKSPFCHKITQTFRRFYNFHALARKTARCQHRSKRGTQVYALSTRVTYYSDNDMRLAHKYEHKEEEKPGSWLLAPASQFPCFQDPGAPGV